MNEHSVPTQSTQEFARAAPHGAPTTASLLLGPAAVAVSPTAAGMDLVVPSTQPSLWPLLAADPVWRRRYRQMLLRERASLRRGKQESGDCEERYDLASSIARTNGLLAKLARVLAELGT